MGVPCRSAYGEQHANMVCLQANSYLPSPVGSLPSSRPPDPDAMGLVAGLSLSFGFGREAVVGRMSGSGWTLSLRLAAFCRASVRAIPDGSWSINALKTWALPCARRMQKGEQSSSAKTAPSLGVIGGSFRRRRLLNRQCEIPRMNWPAPYELQAENTISPDLRNQSRYLPLHIQRPFVWEEEQMLRLFDSLMRNYPILRLRITRITVTVNELTAWDGPLAFVHGSSRARRRFRPAQPQNEQKNALSP